MDVMMSPPGVNERQPSESCIVDPWVNDQKLVLWSAWGRGSTQRTQCDGLMDRRKSGEHLPG